MIVLRVVRGGVGVRVAEAEGSAGAEGEETLRITVSEMLVVSGVIRHRGSASAGQRKLAPYASRAAAKGEQC
jgi:hypothetical protein